LTIANTRAATFARKHNLPWPVTEAALDAALEAEGLTVVDAPETLPVREFRRGKVIGIRVDQDRRWRFWLKAHALGHYLLHRGDQDEYSDQVILSKQERQADEFAACLLLDGALGYDARAVAARVGVPVECVARWLTIP
jgi:hypothetical protein